MVFMLFIDNLPEKINSWWLRNIFRWSGRVIDVFVSMKVRKRTGSRFGFVRYGTRFEALQAIRRCNGTLLERRRLVVKMADSKEIAAPPHNKASPTANPHKQERIFGPNSDRPSQGKVVSTHSQSSLKRKSYAEVVEKAFDESNTSIDASANKYADKIVDGVEVDDEWLCRSVIGEAINIECISGLENAFIGEGVFDISVKYLGGKYVLLTFSSEDFKECVMRGEEKWLDRWFAKYANWNPQWRSYERFAWLSFDGVPLHAWNSTNFKNLANKFGSAISVDKNTLERRFLDRGRVLISTHMHALIQDSLILIVDGNSFPIEVAEDSGSAWNFLSSPCLWPRIATNSTSKEHFSSSSNRVDHNFELSGELQREEVIGCGEDGAYVDVDSLSAIDARGDCLRGDDLGGLHPTGTNADDMAPREEGCELNSNSISNTEPLKSLNGKHAEHNTLEPCAINLPNGCFVAHINSIGLGVSPPPNNQVGCTSNSHAAEPRLDSLIPIATFEPILNATEDGCLDQNLGLSNFFGDETLEEEIVPDTVEEVFQDKDVGRNKNKGGRITHNSRTLFGVKRKLLDELLDRNKGGRLGRKRGDKKYQRKKQGTKKPVGDPNNSGEISGASISEEGIINRNKLIMDEAVAVWKVGRSAGLISRNGDDKVLQKIAELEEKDWDLAAQ